MKESDEIQCAAPVRRGGSSRAKTVISAEADSRLWRRAQEGNAEAFGDLFDRHAPAIYRYCFRRTADHALAEDLTSITFLEAWRRQKESNPEQVLPWLYGIATNVIRNQRRSRLRYRRALKRLPHLRPDDGVADEIDSRLDADQRMSDILERVKRLPAIERDVLALCIWQGLTSSDAAKVLGVPEGTVRTRLLRARTHLEGSGSTRRHNTTQERS
jgi:RNA polymerase sigma factor (sigma-70 family)